jgi:hypothetical protein
MSWILVGAVVVILAAGLIGLGFWLGAPARDANVPDFARNPYEPFSRDAVVAIALREWRLFGEISDDTPTKTIQEMAFGKPERREGLWQRVGEYWWLGLNSDDPLRSRTGKHDEHGNVFAPDQDGSYAWSAAFISYVMRLAGAGDRFPYSECHCDYINEARRASMHQSPRGRVWAHSPETYAPRPGDLICLGEVDDRPLRFSDLPAGHFAGHCDIVVKTEPSVLTVIGGNVNDAVSIKHVPIAQDGKLVGPNGELLDRFRAWAVVVEVLYDR